MMNNSIITSPLNLLQYDNWKKSYPGMLPVDAFGGPHILRLFGDYNTDYKLSVFLIIFVWI